MVSNNKIRIPAKEDKDSGIAAAGIRFASKSAVFFALLVFIVGIGLSLNIYRLTENYDKKISIERFTRQVDDALLRLKNTIQKHETLLYSVQSLFHASRQVSRADFFTYLNSVDVQTIFPGTHAVSWNERVITSQTKEFEHEVRTDRSTTIIGYPDFKVWPQQTDYEDRFVVKYIEPMATNIDAFGFDIGSNKVRRASVEKAAITGNASATAPIQLVQNEEGHFGFLYILPIFNDGDPGNSKQRLNEFRGVAVAVFSIEKLIADAGGLDFATISIFDQSNSVEKSEKSLLYQSGSITPETAFERRERKISIGGRQWVLEFKTTDANDNGYRNLTIVLMGSLISILAALFAWLLSTSRIRALNHADRLTLDLKKTNEDLTRSNTELSQFAHVAAHDLQAPLRNIATCVSLLEAELEKPSDEVNEILLFLGSAAERLRQLLVDLLEFSQVGRAQINLVNINLNDAVAEVIDTLNLRHYSKVEPRFEISPMDNVTADPIMLARVINALIVNALKYQHAERPPLIQIRSHTQGSEIQIIVQDNGIGIEEEFQQTVFIPFRRLHRQESIPGSGLGLGISQQIVERHGGAIMISESSHEGSTFVVSLPHTSLENIK